MNIAFCQMVVMPIIHPTLKIDVMKMEQVFDMGDIDGEKTFSL